MTRAHLLLLALPLAASCQRDEPRRPANRPAPVVERPAPPPAPAVVDAAPAVDVVAVAVADDAGTTAAAGDAGGNFEGDGIQVTVGADGAVRVRATDLWDASSEQTFESCLFVRNALPQLRRTLPEPSVELLVRACGERRANERVPTLRPGGRPAPARPAPARR